MRVVLLRVGIDKGRGGILGPVFRDRSFEFIPIPDGFRQEGVDRRTYGNTRGKRGKHLIEYFPVTRRDKLSNCPIHFDPEFQTYTYGDPTRPKASLRELGNGDLLVFYAGLKGWDCPNDPALYIIGYFEIARAGLANCFPKIELVRLFRNNFHVMHSEVFRAQKDRLVLVKGGNGSRLLRRAQGISALGNDKRGRPIHKLSPKMQEIFGDFGGHTSIQRSPPRWVTAKFTQCAADFVRSLK